MLAVGICHASGSKGVVSFKPGIVCTIEIGRVSFRRHWLTGVCHSRGFLMSICLVGLVDGMGIVI